jgi:hypothetical protein
MTNDKIILEGELFVLVEEDLENEDVNICAEIGGVDLWAWLRNHHGQNIKITAEVIEDD